MKKKNRSRAINVARGFVGVSLLLVVIFLSFVLVGGFTLKNKNASTQSGPMATFACCDTGNGENCKVQENSTITFNGKTYGLLKSNVQMKEGPSHLTDSGEKTSDGDPIVINTSDGLDQGIHKCGGPDDDQLGGPGPGDGACVPIPNDSIIYACKEKCGVTPESEEWMKSPWCQEIKYCYGAPETTFDVYFSLDEASANGIPDLVKNCEQYGEANPTDAARAMKLVIKNPEKKQNLQLDTFYFEGIVAWLSPWCKPAVYLYPEKDSLINVQVSSRLPFTFTDPEYPKNGWDVLADPLGNLSYFGKSYDYLYYETKVPDRLVKKPKEGFVVKKDELGSLFSKILRKLGLNPKETWQFTDYWINALPDSPYYFVGIIPQESLEPIASLLVDPAPDSVIRVTLYFESLKDKISVEEPLIITPKRNGFAVVEWGGIVKRDPTKPFSCFE